MSSSPEVLISKDESCFFCTSLVISSVLPRPPTLLTLYHRTSSVSEVAAGKLYSIGPAVGISLFLESGLPSVFLLAFWSFKLLSEWSIKLFTAFQASLASSFSLSQASPKPGSKVRESHGQVSSDSLLHWFQFSVLVIFLVSMSR